MSLKMGVAEEHDAANPTNNKLAIVTCQKHVILHETLEPNVVPTFAKH